MLDGYTVQQLELLASTKTAEDAAYDLRILQVFNRAQSDKKSIEDFANMLEKLTE